MKIVIAILITLPIVALAWGALSGRVRLASCCATSDPSQDLRMRAAFENGQPPAGQWSPTSRAAVTRLVRS